MTINNEEKTVPGSERDTAFGDSSAVLSPVNIASRSSSQGGFPQRGAPPQKKKKWPIVLSIIVGLAAVLILLWFFVIKTWILSQTSDPVYVSSVASIVGTDLGSVQKFAGIVEPQNTISISKDDTKKILEIHVKEGDEVHPGDKLFTYDTEDIKMTLSQAQLEAESLKGKISTYKSQIADLEKDRTAAAEEDKLSYTLQIQALQLSIKEEEYNQTSGETDIEKLKESLKNVDVLATESGVVKAVNDSDKMDPSGNPLPFISILTTGEYRIKGTFTEQSKSGLYDGLPVLIISRVDPNSTWKGTVQTLDVENPLADNNDMYSMNSGERSSRYNFYVTLESLEGLILGQHVYIQADDGNDVVREGLWLPANYIVHDGNSAYVWAENKHNQLEKRSILLGDYDANDDIYQILKGLTIKDFIATPSETYQAGMPTVTEPTGNMMKEGDNDVFNPEAQYDGAYDDGGNYDENTVIGGEDGGFAPDEVIPDENFDAEKPLEPEGVG